MSKLQTQDNQQQSKMHTVALHIDQRKITNTIIKFYALFATAYRLFDYQHVNKKLQHLYTSTLPDGLN